MARSIRKGPYIDQHLLNKVEVSIASKSKKPIKTWSRRSVVIPDFVGYTFQIHDGRKHVPIYITENMVGHRLGEFAPTRTFRQHGGVKAKKAMQKK